MEAATQRLLAFGYAAIALGGVCVALSGPGSAVTILLALGLLVGWAQFSTG